MILRGYEIRLAFRMMNNSLVYTMVDGDHNNLAGRGVILRSSSTKKLNVLICYLFTAITTVELCIDDDSMVWCSILDRKVANKENNPKYL